MHYVRFGVQVSAPYNFNEWWRNQVPCYQDGCERLEIVRLTSRKASTRTIMHGRHLPQITECPPKYSGYAVDCGVAGWEVSRKVNRIINHHREEVTESKRYKSRPTHILKGGTLNEIHTYLLTFDARDYDPLEHGGFPGETWQL